MADTTLVIKKTYDVPVTKLWSAWTDPEELVKWYGPEGFTNEIHDFNFREGGRYRLTMHVPDGQKHVLHGDFKKIQKPTLLSFT